MGKTSNKAKQRWNDEHYVQIKANVEPEVAERFRSTCKARGVSMAAALSGFMTEYAGTSPMRHNELQVSTRRKRRKELDTLISRVERLLEGEIASMENTPENLQNSQRYEDAERIVAALEDTLASLRELYV